MTDKVIDHDDYLDLLYEAYENLYSQPIRFAVWDWNRISHYDCLMVELETGMRGGKWFTLFSFDAGLSGYAVEGLKNIRDGGLEVSHDQVCTYAKQTLEKIEGEG